MKLRVCRRTHHSSGSARTALQTAEEHHEWHLEKAKNGIEIAMGEERVVREYWEKVSLEP